MTLRAAVVDRTIKLSNIIPLKIRKTPFNQVGTVREVKHCIDGSLLITVGDKSNRMLLKNINNILFYDIVVSLDSFLPRG